MRVLDIDLDFFLSDTCPLAPENARPSDACCRPWPEERVRAFLEDQCALSVKRPLPGRVFATHDGAIDWWHERIAAGKLTVPFHVVHVDAHSDLGIGQTEYVLSSVLATRPEVRWDIARHRALRKLTEANYLLFALAFRWLSGLDNVRNPASKPDLPAICASDGAIRLRHPLADVFERAYGPEPEVPYRVFDDYTRFSSDAPYDAISLALSPRYTPAAADALADVIRRYITIDS